MNFLKKLFSKEPEEISLRQIELKDWLEENSGSFLKEENKNIKDALSKAKEEKIHLKEKLDALEKAELMNKNIPDREIHIMEGNRSNYINRMYSFLEHAKLPESDLEKIESFCDGFHNSIVQLNEDTAKGYFVLKNFFDKDMAGIASSIKEIEEAVKELNSILKESKISSYRKLLARIREINEMFIKKESLSEEISALNNEIKTTKEKKQTFETKLKNLKEGQDFQIHLRMETEKNEIQEGLKKLEDKINNMIKPLDKQIKKISHDTKDMLLQSYLDEPLKALIGDNALHLIDRMTAIRQDIENDAELKDKQKEKLLSYIEEMKKENLENIQKEYKELVSHKAMVEELLSRSSMVMDIKEVEYQIEHVTEKLKRLENESKEKTSMLEKLKVEDKIEKIKEEMSELTGKKILIKEQS